MSTVCLSCIVVLIFMLVLDTISQNGLRTIESLRVRTFVSTVSELCLALWCKV